MTKPKEALTDAPKEAAIAMKSDRTRAEGDFIKQVSVAARESRAKVSSSISKLRPLHLGHLPSNFPDLFLVLSIRYI